MATEETSFLIRHDLFETIENIVMQNDIVQIK